MVKFYITTTLIVSWLTSNAQWSGVGTGINNSVDALVIYNEQLVAGGDSTHLRKWSGSAWSDFAAIDNPTATALFLDDSHLYAGSGFAGGEASKVISDFNGTAWSILGDDTSAYTIVNWNVNNRWDEIFKFNGNLYAVYTEGLVKYDALNHEFVTVGDQVADLGEMITEINYGGMLNNTLWFSGATGGKERVFTWNDSNWDTLDLSSYPGRDIYDVAIVNNDVFIAGYAGGAGYYAMLKWDGTVLTPYLPWTSGAPITYNLFACDGRLYGHYRSLDYHFGVWGADNYIPLATVNEDDQVNDVKEFNGFVYAGGIFTTFAGVNVNNIAKRTILVGIEENNAMSALPAFPNPAVSYVSLTDSGLGRIVDIYNSLGQVCRTVKMLPGENVLSVEGLSPGMYLIAINDGKKIVTERIVKG